MLTTSRDEWLRDRLGELGLFLVPNAVERLGQYFDLLRRWNRIINLASLANLVTARDRLIVEPALAAPWLPSGAFLIDFGSGGGSPAIPLKLVAPSISLTMVEVRSRKAAFLREAARALQLDRTDVIISRFEELPRTGGFAARFDVVTARAVKVDLDLLDAAAFLLRAGGELWLFRSEGARDEAVEPLFEPGPELLPLVPGTGAVLARFRRLAERV